ncbi:MAG: FtsK/SpoIIIE domain-containing protein [Isosphaerales bacterium]
MSTTTTSPGTSAVAESSPRVTAHAPSEPEVMGRERATLSEILRLVAERALAEAKLEGEAASSNATADSEYQKARKALVEKLETLDREARTNDEKRRRAIIDAAIEGEAKAKAEFAAASRKIATLFESFRDTAKTDYSAGKAEAAATFDSGQKKAAKEHAAKTKPIDDSARLADSTRNRLASLAADYLKFGLNPEPPKPSPESYDKLDDPGDELFTRLTRMETPLRLLEGLIIPKSLKGKREAWIFIVLILMMVGLVAYFGGGELIGMGAAAVAGATIAFLLRTWLAKLSKFQLERVYTPLMQNLADADGLTAYCRSLVDSAFKEQRRRVTTRRDDDLKRVEENYRQAFIAAEAQRDERLRKINEVYAEGMVAIQTRQQRDLREALDAHDRLMAEIRARSETSPPKLDNKYKALKEQIRTDRDAAWLATAQRWREGMKRAAAELGAVNLEVDGYCPIWNDPAWADRSLPRLVPPVVRFGSVEIDLASLPQGISADARMMEGVPSAFTFPALRPFPAGANLLIETPAEGRGAALDVLQASMFRLLTSLPPAQVRFTIVDPIGIGRNFGAFMHLADFDGALVTNQVWTDPRQIEERLADLAAHMETVTQKYLRNEYATIEEYNAVAEEVAEPYRVLVVADFPTKFDEKSAARLAAIAAGGTPCGVLTLIAVDLSKPLPPGFQLDELRPCCAHLTWDSSRARLAWDDRDLGHHPLALDPPPPGEFATRQIQKVGAAAKDAKRVEVPFEFISPPPAAYWTRDSRAGIDVPLGKAGATKRQHFELGQGTSQHVLIAGRTGSGKSTLMHALITNLALNYSPDEIDLYLIDFKKGVEFKVYATHELPHASVVAIESEREFGISVLERLDAELRLRADRFRDAGVQDLGGYRNVPGTPPLPRILLIVDEFQEFFVEEDKLAQEAALWLDRLVRQGRAFGVHVILGSQSLGGAFTLARSTLGQMAVRIALQCSENDAHLILSENNIAPRMLSRPGEAIYNDANGAPEGNHFFQVVWLSDERREAYLKLLHERARERKPILSRTPIVFEGDAPADLARNPLLRQPLEDSIWPETPRSVRAWVGDAVSIKEPTSALFRRQGGNHLLIVGQNEEAALGVAVSTLLSLAAQLAPAGSDSVRQGARFFVLDGTPEDHPNAGVLLRVAAALPHGARAGGWREVPQILAAVAAEVQRRQEAKTDGPELFLFIHDLPRFRDLRRREDDFSFSRREEEAAPPDHLDLILREGPVLGVHLVTWCDSVNNLNRYFTHQVLREFEMRVLFQMSPADSGHMLDAPHASKLGPHRAFFVSEEQNRHEKFRPYGIPSTDWLGWVSEQLSKRT